MSQILGFVSLTGDAEKSDFLVNLAASLSRLGKRVLLVDLGCPVPALDLLSGVAESVVYTASDVAMGQASLSDAALPIAIKDSKNKAGGSVFLLPSSCLDNGTEDVVPSLLSVVRREKDYDLTLVSFSHATCVRKGLDGLFLLTRTDEVSLRAAETRQREMGADACLLMDYPTRWDFLCDLPSLLSIADRLALPLLGVVPCVPTGLTGILPHGSRSRDYLRAVRNVASRMMGTSVPLLAGVTLDGVSRRRLLKREK